jgi:hypothetical protein
MISEYMRQYFKLFKEGIKNQKEFQWSSSGFVKRERERSPADSSLSRNSFMVSPPTSSVGQRAIID